MTTTIFFKLTLFSLLACSTLQALGQGSCKNCINCSTNGRYSWCNACLRSKHVMTVPGDGYCEGSSSPILNCMVTYSAVEGQRCLICEENHGVYSHPNRADNTFQKEDYKCYELKIAHSVKGYFVYNPVTFNKDERTTACKEGFEPSALKTSCDRKNTNVLNSYMEIDDCLEYDANGCQRCIGSRRLFSMQSPAIIHPTTNNIPGLSTKFKKCFLSDFSDFGAARSISSANLIKSGYFVEGGCNPIGSFSVNRAYPHGFAGAGVLNDGSVASSR